MAKQGVLIQDSDGSLYFIRPEVLQSAKLPKSMHKDATTAIKAGKRPSMKVVGALAIVAGDTKDTAKASQVAARGAALRSTVSVADLNIGARASTIMCPW
jgi:hypothetical protein